MVAEMNAQHNSTHEWLQRCCWLEDSRRISDEVSKRKSQHMPCVHHVDSTGKNHCVLPVRSICMMESCTACMLGRKEGSRASMASTGACIAPSLRLTSPVSSPSHGSCSSPLRAALT